MNFICQRSFYRRYNFFSAIKMICQRNLNECIPNRRQLDRHVRMYNSNSRNDLAYSIQSHVATLPVTRNFERATSFDSFELISISFAKLTTVYPEVFSLFNVQSNFRLFAVNTVQTFGLTIRSTNWLESGSTILRVRFSFVF